MYFIDQIFNGCCKLGQQNEAPNKSPCTLYQAYIFKIWIPVMMHARDTGSSKMSFIAKYGRSAGTIDLSRSMCEVRQVCLIRQPRAEYWRTLRLDSVFKMVLVVWQSLARILEKMIANSESIPRCRQYTIPKQKCLYGQEEIMQGEPVRKQCDNAHDDNERSDAF